MFAAHNLVSDRSFNEFHVVICRNVLIYFDRQLQEHVHQLFLDSLTPFGILALGRKESLAHSSHADAFDVLDETERIYRKRSRTVRRGAPQRATTA